MGERDSSNRPTVQHSTPVDPFKYPRLKKWIITITTALLTFTCTFASSIFSSTIAVTAVEFQVSETVMILGVSLFVLGFALGPIVWGPWSEVHGRRLPLFVGYAGFALLQLPVALAPDLSAVLIGRFLAGCFGAAPVALASAIYADFWEPAERGVATAVYSAAAFGGPTCGPIVGGFLVESRLGWRWTAWITLIMTGVFGPLAYFCVPETYGPVLKQRSSKKEKDLNKSHQDTTAMTASAFSNLTRTKSAASSMEISKNFLQKFLLKPAIMLGTEPMLLATTVYISLVYGILYLTFYAIPYSFTIERGWRPQIGTLPFVSMLLGVLTSCAFVAWYSKAYYLPRLQARPDHHVVPEDRLPPIILGGVLLPIGLLWFAWTSSPHVVTWIPQVLSGFLIGAGIMLVFTNGIAFIIDVYLSSAASAMAANTSLRSFVAAGLPLAGPSMYSRLGTAWAMSLLAFVCIVLIPVPLLFYRYGSKLRARSRYAIASR